MHGVLVGYEQRCGESVCKCDAAQQGPWSAEIERGSKVMRPICVSWEMCACLVVCASPVPIC